jgi:hypothetical protein
MIVIFLILLRLVVSLHLFGKQPSQILRCGPLEPLKVGPQHLSNLKSADVFFSFAQPWQIFLEFPEL